MVRTLKILGLGALLWVGLSGCDKSLLDGELRADQGTLTARLHTVPGASKAAQVELEAPSLDAFSVVVRSAAAEEVYTSLYSEFPYSLNLTEGSYTIEAAHGQKVPFVTENPYYFIRKPFDIERGSATSVELTARLVGFGVEGVFDADMADHFASWQLEAEIDQVWDESYRWAVGGETPRAYFLPGQVRVILRGVRHNGAAFSQVIKEIQSSGGELYTLKIHILPAGHALSVSVDTERRVVTDQGIVSVDALPDLEAPVLGAMTFYETTTVPVDGTAATAELRSFVGFSEVSLTIPKAGYGLEARAYRWSEAADRAALRVAGLDLGADDLSTVRSTTLNAKGLVGAMLADAAVERAYDIQVEVTDGTGKVGVSTLPVRIERPEFKVMVPRGNLWSKTIELSGLTVEATEGKGSSEVLQTSDQVAYQLSADQGTTWRAVTAQEWAAQKIMGLTAGTTYLFRGTYRGTPGLTAALTTEAAAQIPNSDFETYQDTREVKKNRPFFRWAKEGVEWWGSLNALTCNTAGGDYWYVSQSSTRATTGRSGYGVLVVTVGYGGANTWAGFMWSAAIYNVKSGRLFLGTYDGAQRNGQAFASRPTALTYWYKWAKHPSQSDQTTTSVWVENRTDGVVTRLGEGSFTTSTNVGGFTQKRIDITYTNTTLAPTHLCMEFQSGQNDDAKKYLYDKIDEGGDTYYYGSRLWVDDVELIYEK